MYRSISTRYYAICLPVQCVYKRAVSNMSEFQKHVLCSGAENTKMKSPHSINSMGCYKMALRTLKSLFKPIINPDFV